MFDYRVLPYDKLNSNIPRGRGMIKWMPFATMPEQYENINILIENQDFKLPPNLSDDRIENNERVALNLLRKKAIVRYWSAGKEIMLECMIESIDYQNKLIIIVKNEKVLPIFFYHIYEITKGGNLDNVI